MILVYLNAHFCLPLDISVRNNYSAIHISYFIIFMRIYANFLHSNVCIVKGPASDEVSGVEGTWFKLLIKIRL